MVLIVFAFLVLKKPTILYNEKKLKLLSFIKIFFLKRNIEFFKRLNFIPFLIIDTACYVKRNANTDEHMETSR